jgi:hypothetical protein
MAALLLRPRLNHPFSLVYSTLTVEIKFPISPSWGFAAPGMMKIGLNTNNGR